MIRSMTGFTSCSKLLTINNQKIPLTINIKSLNSRYFDFNARIPYPLSNLETDFMRLCKSMLYRGSIIFSIHAANPQAFKGPIEPSTNTIKNYLKALEAIQKECAIQGSLSLSDVIMLPNIFSTEEIDIDDTTKQELFDLAHKALDQLIQAQTAEGKALLEDILNRLEIVNQEIEKIEKAFTAILQAQKEKVNSALSLLESDTSKFAEVEELS